jgi:hypothetical protein
MQFVISSYGNAFSPFLAVSLRSLRLSHPGRRVTVLYDKLRTSTLSALRQQNPDARFVAVNVEKGRSIDSHKRIAGRMEHWSAVLEQLDPNDSDVVAFVDADMIVRSDLEVALPESFDVIFTSKPQERIPINAGFIALRLSSKTKAFMKEWSALTAQMTADPPRLEEAVKKMGAADQQALLDLMQNPALLGVSDRSYPFGDIRIVGMPCALLNETNSVPLSAPALVLHYKGGWHKILLRDAPFSSHRPQDVSQEMYDLWFAYLEAEETELGMKLRSRWTRLKDVFSRKH